MARLDCACGWRLGEQCFFATCALRRDGKKREYIVFIFKGGERIVSRGKENHDGVVYLEIRESFCECVRKNVDFLRVLNRKRLKLDMMRERAAFIGVFRRFEAASSAIF